MRANPRRPSRRGVSALLFLIALAVYLAFSVGQVATKAIGAYRQVSSDTRVLSAKHPYHCHSDECVTCLSSIENNANEIIFTGSSTQKTAVDSDVVSAASGRPVVNCGIGGSRMEDFSALLNKAVKNKESQDIFHGYTYWEVNRPEPRYVNIVQPRTRTSTRDYLNTLTEYMSQIQFNMRVRLFRLGVPYHLLVAPFLAESDWPDAREHAQRRSFRFNLFGDGTVGSKTQMELRLERFIESQRPFHRLVFFTSPDYRPLIHEGTDPAIIDAVDNVIAAVADKHPDVMFVKMSAESCGLIREDFWKSEEMTLDPFHTLPSGRKKFTSCLLAEVERRGLFQ